MLYIRESVPDKAVVNKYNFNSIVLPKMNVVHHTTVLHLPGSVLKFKCLKLMHAEKCVFLIAVMCTDNPGYYPV